jgi:hypothetical protein
MSELGAVASFPKKSEVRSHWMKTSLVTLVLAFAAFAVAQDAAQQPQAQPAAGQQQAQPAAGQAQQKKEIKDPAEYNAYVAAIQQQDNNAKISGLESFLQQYPKSVVREDGMETLMAAYQQAGNQPKVEDTAGRLLQLNPNNLRALALKSYLDRAKAVAGQNPQQNLTEGLELSKRGLAALPTAPKPEGMKDDEFTKMKAQMATIFNGTSGIASMFNKDYAGAQTYLREALKGDPTSIELAYNLALSYFQATPPDTVNGIFFGARAVGLAATPAQGAQIEKYVKSQYKKYHGSDEGWTDVLAKAKANAEPPSDYTVKQYVPPTPAEECRDRLKGKPPKDWDFAEWQQCLSKGDQADRDTVWNAIKDQPLQMKARALKVTPTRIEIAASLDDIDAKKTDLVLNMTAAIPAKLMPKEGEDFAFEGTPSSYTPDPFVIELNKGMLFGAAPKPPAKKPPVHRKPAAR